MLKPEVKDYVGFHVGGPREVLYREKIPYYSEKGYKVFQLFLHSPKVYTPPRIETFRYYKEGLPPNSIIIAHGPYIISPVSDNNSEIFKKTLFNTFKSLDVCSFMGFPYYVMHCGGIRPYEGAQQGYDNLRKFCFSVIEYIESRNLNVTLCLENDPGSSTGRKIGSLSLLYKLIKEINDPHIRLAYDTEHGYANGFDFSSDSLLVKTKKILEISSVVHLNAVPDNVKLGGHLDRHSKTLLVESKTGVDPLFDIFMLAIADKKPMILERGGFEYVEKDVEYLEKKFESIDFDVIDAELVYE